MTITRLEPIGKSNRRLCIAMSNIWSKSQAVTSDEAVFLAWIKEGLDTARRRNDVGRDIELQWNQGACQVLEEILDSFEVAKIVLSGD